MNMFYVIIHNRRSRRQPWYNETVKFIMKQLREESSACLKWKDIPRYSISPNANQQRSSHKFCYEAHEIPVNAVSKQVKQALRPAFIMNKWRDVNRNQGWKWWAINGLQLHMRWTSCINQARGRTEL